MESREEGITLHCEVRKVRDNDTIEWGEGKRDILHNDEVRKEEVHTGYWKRKERG